jgi:hypothetical protein
MAHHLRLTLPSRKKGYSRMHPIISPVTTAPHHRHRRFHGDVPARLFIISLVIAATLLVMIPAHVVHAASARSFDCSTTESGVHTATWDNTRSLRFSILSDAIHCPTTQETVLVTPNYAPNGVCGCVFDTAPLGVVWSGSNWDLVHEDGTAIPIGATYNVITTPLYTTSINSESEVVTASVDSSCQQRSAQAHQRVWCTRDGCWQAEVRSDQSQVRCDATPAAVTTQIPLARTSAASPA